MRRFLAGVVLALGLTGPASAILFSIVAGQSGALVSDFGLVGPYSSADAVNPTALATITVNTDGTWAITVGPGDVLTGTPASGTWLHPATAGYSHEYQVQFVVTNQVNAPTIVNDAAAFTTVTSNLALQISKGGGATASADITVNLRRVGSSTTELTDTANFQVDGT